MYKKLQHKEGLIKSSKILLFLLHNLLEKKDKSLYNNNAKMLISVRGI